MPNLGITLSRPALASLVMLGAFAGGAAAGDLSRYRDFSLGADLTTVAKQTGLSPSQAKVIQTRPALIQELDWRPQSLGHAPKSEPAQSVVFSFYNDELFRISVNYDRYETEGLTPDDIIEAVSTAYGVAKAPPAPVVAAEGRYGDQEEILARWQDSLYRFDLIRSSYGPSYRLVGVQKRLEAPVQAAIVEAARLDAANAPQREAARIAITDEAAKVKLEKARLVNKPKFRL